MARIRYLKPDFFKDEDIKDLPYDIRLFFQGLWCQADKSGRLEDRPERLKVEIMPYENKFDVEKALQILEKPKRASHRPFIVRYKINEDSYIQILSWGKHQKPHHTETESIIPPPPESVLEQLNNAQITVKEPLDNGLIDKGNGKGNGEYIYNDKFLQFWNLYPRKVRKKDSFVAWKRLNKKQQDEIIKAVENYSSECKSKERKEEFILLPKTFLNKDRELWKDYLNPPKKEESLADYVKKKEEEDPF